MPDMLKTRVVLQASVLLLLHHLLVVVVYTGCTSGVSCILLSALVVLIVIPSLVGKVLRAFVFVSSAILCRSQCLVRCPPRCTQPLTYWNLAIVSLMSPDEYSYSFLLCPKMMTATSTEHSTESSCAFLNKPPLRLRKVTDLE
jgi:hypothetical protein